MARKKVLKVRRSPTNRHEWILKLACGHEVTMTTSGRPTERAVRCFKCQNPQPALVKFDRS